MAKVRCPECKHTHQSQLDGICVLCPCLSEPPAEEASAEQIAHWKGAYDICCRLLTWPGFNKSARETITNEALNLKDQLERSGIAFQPEAVT